MNDLTVADRITADLTNRIVTGDLAPGERLRQDGLALLYRTSQAPVREAFLRLEARCLVISRPRQGVRVAPLEPQDEREIIAMRMALETLALRNVRVRPGPRQLARLDAVLEDGAAARDLVMWEQANRAFHTGLAALSGMPRLTETVADLNLAYSRHVLARDRSALWTPRSNHDHQRIRDAVASGQFAAAEALLERHIAAGERLRTHAAASPEPGDAA